MEAAPSPYDDLHGRARRDAETRGPVLWLCLCGYEYALHHAGDAITCVQCGDRVVGQDQVTLHASVAFTDLSQPLGRRHVPMGLCCSETCADKLYVAFLLKRGIGLNDAATVDGADPLEVRA